MRVLAITKFKNEAFYKARTERGLSQITLAKMVGVMPVDISNYEGFRSIPKKLHVIAALEEVLGLPFRELFPLEYEVAIAKKIGKGRSRSFEVTMAMIAESEKESLLLPDPQSQAEASEMSTRITAELDSVIALLKPRQQFIIRERYLGPEQKSFEAIGQSLKVTHERVRQIEAKALRIIGWHLRRRGVYPSP